MEEKKQSEIRKLWEEFKVDIVSRNRYFPEKNILPLLEKIKMIKMFPNDTEMELYRARIGDFSKKKESNLLAPPEALSGRCNPEGISYLYLSNCLRTAVSEVRPNSGDVVTLAKIKTNVTNLFSFRIYFQNLPLPLNPNSEDSNFLIKLIDTDLASRVKKDSKLEYVPFQYISEYIKNKGFNGIAYSSTVGPGMNLTIFDWKDKVKITQRTLINIKDVCYHF